MKIENCIFLRFLVVLFFFFKEEEEKVIFTFFLMKIVFTFLVTNFQKENNFYLKSTVGDDISY
jgi:hypothetical protein